MVNIVENIIFRKSWFKTLKRWEPNKVYEFILILERFVNDEKLNVPDNMMDFWDQVEPLLKSDLSKYENVVERNRNNGKSGGRPRKTQTNPQEPNITQENPMGYLETQQNPKNLKEKEKEKEIEKEKEKDKRTDNKPVGGFEKLLKVFPPTKVYSEHECLAIWDSLTQDEKQKVIKHSSVYVRELTKKNEVKFIKNLKSYLESRVWENVSGSKKKTEYGRAMTKHGIDGNFVLWVAKLSETSFDNAMKDIQTCDDDEYMELQRMYQEEKQ